MNGRIKEIEEEARRYGIRTYEVFKRTIGIGTSEEELEEEYRNYVSIAIGSYNYSMALRR